MALSLGGCSQPNVGCSLAQIHGYLIAVNGRAVLSRLGEITPLLLAWPDGWTVRPTNDGQLEVVEPAAGGYKDAGKVVTGTVRARTGTSIMLYGVADPVTSSFWIRDGELVVCPGPISYSDYVPPDGDAP